MNITTLPQRRDVHFRCHGRLTSGSEVPEKTYCVKCSVVILKCGSNQKVLQTKRRSYIFQVYVHTYVKTFKLTNLVKSAPECVYLEYNCALDQETTDGGRNLLHLRLDHLDRDDTLSNRQLLAPSSEQRQRCYHFW